MSRITLSCCVLGLCCVGLAILNILRPPSFTTGWAAGCCFACAALCFLPAVRLWLIDRKYNRAMRRILKELNECNSPD